MEGKDTVIKDIQIELESLEEDFIFEAMLVGWPTEWGEGHPSHVRRLWGLGTKGELMLVERDAKAALPLEGIIVEGTDAATRPTPPNGIPRPSDISTRPPYLQLKSRRLPTGEIPVR